MSSSACESFTRLPTRNNPIDGDNKTFAVGEWYHIPAGVEHAAHFDVDSAEVEFWFAQ